MGKPVFDCGNGIFVEDPTQCAEKPHLLLDGKARVALSRVMTAVLRHIPFEAGIILDVEGWVSIEKLAEGIRRRWKKFSWVKPTHILAVAYLDPKGRFEVRDGMIRARYGHSIPARIKYEVDNDVKVLYHGTPVTNLQSIMRSGLLRGRRLWVHLTLSPDDAIETGLRHGRPVALLIVNAECLRSKGFEVFKASKAVRVVLRVPPECISSVEVVE
ncbi:MAG: RNA 2'-phosphotransferase [Desulfurococcales archaeon]|nr:RNA 2'-phosphotransferase [Desulfurococcales archaeon]